MPKSVKRWRRAFRLCDKMTKKIKDTHRVVQEFNMFHIVTEYEYVNAFKQFCEDAEFDMKLVYTKKYYGESN